jgi:hypothetical protein
MAADPALSHAQRLRRAAEAELPRGLNKHANGIEWRCKLCNLLINFTYHQSLFRS